GLQVVCGGDGIRSPWIRRWTGAPGNSALQIEHRTAGRTVPCCLPRDARPREVRRGVTPSAVVHPQKTARHKRWSEASVWRAGAGERRRQSCSTEGRAKAASSVQAEAASGGCSVAGEVCSGLHVPLVNSVIEFVKLEKKNISAMAAACITCERAP
ncbi:unnamed protein product, partial [Urochloa humidicola]